MNRYIFLVFVFFILFSCSTAQKSEDTILEISSITPTILDSSKMPTESANQVNVELFGVVSDDTLLNKDVVYGWHVEKIPLDIQDTAANENDLSSDTPSQVRDYYMEVSKKDSLNAILSVYAPGYYKVTLKGATSLLDSEYAVILKIGSPEFPKLSIKMNIPVIQGAGEDDFKGSVYLRYSGLKNISVFDAAQMRDDWYTTDIRIDPFKSFSIRAGTHVVEDKEANKYIASLSSLEHLKGPSLLYKVDNGKGQEILLSPVELDGLSNAKQFSVYKSDSYTWTGGLTVSYLAWGKGEDGEVFTFRESVVTNDNPVSNYPLGDAYQVKIFIGSFGHRVVPYDYFVYFSPEGSELDELNKRNAPEDRIYPYGYLLGKLGENGKVFSIGKYYSYSYLGSIPVYNLVDGGVFVKQ